jgi:hypothetical protein
MRSLARVSILLYSLLVIGCQLTPTFTTGYEIKQSSLQPSPVAERLVVVPFSEERGPRYYNTPGRLFLTYVPLIPYVTMRWERLEESIRVQSESIAAAGRGITLGARQDVAPPFYEYYYPNSFARAIAEDLAATGLFQHVEYGSEAEAENSRYVLRGNVSETPLRTSTTSFGLGIVGVLLWFLPVPMAKTTAEIGLDLDLTDNETGEVIWERHLESGLNRYITLYTSSAMVYGRGGAFSFNLVPPPGDSKVDRRSLFSWHFEALRRGMLDSKDDLARALSARH